MKRNLLLVGLVLALVGLPGCIVVCTDEVKSYEPSVVEPEDVAIREIDAVGKLAFEDDRQHGYRQIARRASLADGAQVYLIEAVFKRLAFEDAKVDVLLTLVRNPAFSVAAEAALLDRLDRLAFEDNRRKVLDAIDKRKA